MKRKVLKVLMVCLLLINTVYAQQLAFPGADGFGKYATGGRGGSVIEVTNLNDDGEGSLRDALEQSGARTIVFRVSGTIYLESTLIVKNDDVTIAGQTAPGDGITLANYTFQVKADNVIIRYIRSRMGDVKQVESDAFTCRYYDNIIVDHCSFSWSIDECASTYLNTNFTMQWCIISESLHDSYHSKKAHGYGGIWGGSRASFHHNLIAHHTSRNPRFNGARYSSAPWEEIVDFRNNVIYNWGSNSIYGGEASDEDDIRAQINMVANYFKYGPATPSDKIKYRIVAPDADDTYGYSYWYIDSNYVYAYSNASKDNWTYGVQEVTTEVKDTIKSTTAFEFDMESTQNAEAAYLNVLMHVGTSMPARDTIDKRIVYETENGVATYGGVFGKGTGIIDSQDDVGGWPELESGTAPTDSDQDGMADDWETENGFDSTDASDRNEDTDGDGYTNLEEYLNSLAHDATPVDDPTDLSAGYTNEDGVTLTWEDNSTNETGFYIERKTGNNYERVDTVDADTKIYTDADVSEDEDYDYRIMAFNDDNTSDYCESVSITTTETAIENQTEAISLKIFPNPANSTLYIQNINTSEQILITISDLSGRIHRTVEVNGQSPVSLNITDLTEGYYFISCKSDKTISVEKLLIVR